MNKYNIKVFGVIIIICVIIGCLYCIQQTYNATVSENISLEDNWIQVQKIDITYVTNDLIGYLSIPKFNDNYYINMPIKESTELNILATAIGHFSQTPLDNGNVCLVAHNSGTNKSGKYVGFFDSIKKLEIEDVIIYNNLSKIFRYEVISNNIIKETDISVLDNTDENMLTLITCIGGRENRAYRQCVVAKRIQ